MNISDVEKLTGLTSTAIRFYERCGLLKVNRQENGYRSYDSDGVELLRQIRQMREIGISLSNIRLWCDKVVTKEELVRKRLREMDDDFQKTDDQRRICERILARKDEGTLPLSSTLFSESEMIATVSEGERLLLGIDIGTTSISAQLVSVERGTCVETYNFDHMTAIELDGYPDAYVCDAEKLVDRALALVNSLLSTYKGICSVGVSAQMHGIVCTDDKGDILSPLYTWQNQFGTRMIGDGKTICDEIRGLCEENIPTGYGVTTYYALRELGLLPEGTEKLVSIGDLLVSRLIKCLPAAHPTVAAAYGAFDIRKGDFDSEKLLKLGISRKLLPDIADDYVLAGVYSINGRDIKVASSIGDNQAGLYGSVSDENSVLVNVGTSSQVSLICHDVNHRGGEIRPYFDGLYICSGAALCGGRAYAQLKDLVASFVKGLGFDVRDADIYEYLNKAALSGGNSLCVSTAFSGSRSDPTSRGHITNIGLDNFTPEDLSAGVLRGIVSELAEMYADMAEPDHRVRIIASGNAMRRNPALRKICAQFFGKKALVPRWTEEAALGAALYGGVSAGGITRAQSFNFIKYIGEGDE